MLDAQTTAEALQYHPKAVQTPLVVDANVLIRDVCAVLRRPEVTALLGQIEAGMATLFVAPGIPDEVETRMHRVARQNTEAALALWRARYLPHVRVVDPGPVGSLNLDAVAGVIARDPSDGPTAELALLCAPCLCLTGDAHLLDSGFGGAEWLAGLRTSGELEDFDAAAWIAANLSFVSLGEVTKGLATVARQIGRSPAAAGVVLGLLVFALTDGRPLVARSATRASASGAGALLKTFDLLDRLGAQRAALKNRLSEHVVPSLHAPPPEAQIASVLARSAVPIGVGDLSTRVAQPAAEVRASLRAHPAFVVAPGKGWQLGCSSAAASE